jgi:DNA-binding beta-propeller fold protein YncE
MKRLTALVALLVLAAGCSNPGKDPLQITNNAVAATPSSVPLSKPPAGQRISVNAPVHATVFSAQARTLALATDKQLKLYPADKLTAPRTVALPAAPGEVSVADDGSLLVPIPTRHVLLTVDPRTGKSTSTPVTGAPVSAASFKGESLVALPDRHGVAVVRGGQQRKLITSAVTPAQVFVAGGHPVVLDTKSTAVYDLNVATGSFGAGLRAGTGASRAVTDRYGRFLVTDTRTGSLLAFSASPVLTRQMFPVKGAPFGIAYDSTRDLIWVTLTGSNEVAGYAVGRGEPVLKYRFPTVSQPDSVAVDPRSGAVYVSSAGRDGLAVVRP